jgi:hypothetical protein
MAILAFGTETGLWATMAKNGDGPQKASDLAVTLGIDPPLLQRLMRHLGTLGHLTETGPDEYLPTNFSKALALPQIGDAYPTL